MFSVEERLARVERRRARPAAARTPRPFGWEWVREFMPDHFTQTPSRLHLETMDLLAGFHTRRGSRLNLIAPRGFAKSTLVSKAYPAWCVLEGVEPFVLKLSDTAEQAELFLDAVKAVVESDAVKAHYGDRVGAVWQVSKVRTRDGFMIATGGAKGRIRGKANRNRRPTLVITDDANKKEDAYSPTQRRRVLDWMKRDVMPVGEPGFTNFLSVGTAVHREALVCDLASNPTWESRRYRAVERWPDRMDLWHEWERVLSNQGDPDRRPKAAAFYAANRVAMDAGAELLWPERFPLAFLMGELASLGKAVFDSEYGDTPGTEGFAEWPPDYFDRPGLWFDAWPDDLAGKAYYLDPSKGEGSKPGDYQAHVWGGWSRSLNALCVEADLRREPVTDMVSRAIANAQRFGCPVTAETNGTMGLLIAEFERQANGRMVGLQGITNTDAKLQRIRTLGPYLARGQVRVRNTAGGRQLVDQLRDVPNGEYDDGPDAASGALRRVLVNLNGGR